MAESWICGLIAGMIVWMAILTALLAVRGARYERWMDDETDRRREGDGEARQMAWDAKNRLYDLMEHLGLKFEERPAHRTLVKARTPAATE